METNGWMEGVFAIPGGCQTDHLDSDYQAWIHAIWCHFSSGTKNIKRKNEDNSNTFSTASN